MTGHGVKQAEAARRGVKAFNCQLREPDIARLERVRGLLGARSDNDTMCRALRVAELLLGALDEGRQVSIDGTAIRLIV